MSALIKPNFFLVGAAKSGTTSLASYLDQHPSVFMSQPKEPNFFAFPPDSTPSCNGPLDGDVLFERLLKYSTTSEQAYLALFNAAGTASIVGEASVRYLYQPEVPARLAGFCPDARIVVIIRNPAERMYSHYHMNVMAQLEPLTFEAALAAEDARIAQGWGWDWHYRRVSMYADQLERYFAAFAPEQIAVFDYGDFQADPKLLSGKVLEHLGVNDPFEFDCSSSGMVGAAPRSRWLRNLIWEDSLLKRLGRKAVPGGLRRKVSAYVERKNQSTIPPMSDALREALTAQFEEQRVKLEQMLGRPVCW
ncbi:sulfotransferase family protein [Mangrovimicrobium sediminis]|uniref:sulfotransferase family protein n=1 Tax=Mangrovimicrobium sediminis TaxID=2562682 RepID=UPI0014368562|nr:sulfotransferase [Haliea sp. SAOS-164]